MQLKTCPLFTLTLPWLLLPSLLPHYFRVHPRRHTPHLCTNIRNMPSAHVCVPVWRMAWAVWFRITWAECFRPRKGRLKKYWRVYKDGEFGRYYLHGCRLSAMPSPLPQAGSGLMLCIAPSFWLQANCCAMPWFIGEWTQLPDKFPQSKIKAVWMIQTAFAFNSTITRLSQCFRTGSRYCHR